MSDTQIIIVLVIVASAIVIMGCVALIVMFRLRRAVKSQFETLEGLLSALRTDQGRDQPGGRQE